MHTFTSFVLNRMRQFVTIIFVLIFALAGRSQSQDFSYKQINCNTTFFANRNLSCQNPILFLNDCFDVQDTNDLDGFDSVIILSGTHCNFEYFEIKIAPAILPRLRLLQVGELLLDLPPPLLSV